MQVAGTVTAVSTLLRRQWCSSTSSGKITANNSLFQATPAAGTIIGTSANNLTGTNPLLATAGLAGNGGPTKHHRLADRQRPGHWRAGANPEKLLADQSRGEPPRGGAGTTDIKRTSITQRLTQRRPTATLTAPAVTASNASTLNPYSFSVKYPDNTAIAASSLVGAVVDVTPPGGSGCDHRESRLDLVSRLDRLTGDAQGFVVTYQIDAPRRQYLDVAADSRIYAVTPAGTPPVTDLSGATPSASRNAGELLRSALSQLQHRRRRSSSRTRRRRGTGSAPTARRDLTSFPARPSLLGRHRHT